MNTLGWPFQLANITHGFEIKSESVYYGKTRIKCNIETGYFPPNHAIKATVIGESNHHCRTFDFCRSNARIIKFQKTFSLEALTNNETPTLWTPTQSTHVHRPF